MADRRIFLDWNRPALHSAAEQLLCLAPSESPFDLSQFIVVLPGRQAIRRLQELLCVASGNKCSLPRMITVGGLPEMLYTPKFPFATALTQGFAWAEALKGLRREDLEVIIPQPPDYGDVPAWLKLGELLSRQHRELTAGRIDFSDVAQQGESLPDFEESERWNILAQVQSQYLKQLDDLDLWDQQTARLYAIDHHECQTAHQIVLIGTVDLNNTLRGMLDAVRDQVTVMIHAPDNWDDRFDEFGRLHASAWVDQEIEIGDEQIAVVDGPEQQAEIVALELAERAEHDAITETTICVPDDRLVPQLRRTLSQVGVSANWAIGPSFAESRPFRLLEAIAAYLSTFATDDFASLIRHPDMTTWINKQLKNPEWLTDWDSYVAGNFQRHTRKIIGTGKATATVRRLVKLVQDLLKPLQRTSRILPEWFEPIRHLLLLMYGDRDFDLSSTADQHVLKSIEAITNAWSEHDELPELLSPVVAAPEAIRLTLNQICRENLPAFGEEAAVELSGWLDMPLDDAPFAIITTFNEGYVPSSVNHDLFLPNRLRAHLGLEDNEQRYARDAYSLSAILASRKHVKLIAARRDVHDDPLIPSRLLFATSPERVAERVQRFFGENSGAVHVQFASSLRVPKQSGFRIPRPDSSIAPRRSFRVTEFRDYLASPYRYYLRHILGLEEVSDEVVELDARAFGSFIHQVLQEFGESDETRQTDPHRIASFLHSTLDRLAKQTFGSDALFPIYVQIEQIRHRFEAFAQWQANWVRQGWEIRFTEIGYGKNATFPLHDGTTIQLRGRIDRIDFNPRTSQWMIFDYKTGDKGESPEQTHRNKLDWIDLQLPLYRHLAEPFGVRGDVGLAYIVFPRSAGEVGAKVAEWTPDELQIADDVVRVTAQKIIDQEFWVPQARPPQWESEFASICQDGVFGQEVLL